MLQPEDEIVFYRVLEQQPAIVPILRHMCDARIETRTGIAFQCLAEQFQIAAAHLQQPGNHFDQLGLPIPLDPSNPQDLPAPEFQVYTVERSGAVTLFYPHTTQSQS